MQDSCFTCRIPTGPYAWGVGLKVLVVVFRVDSGGYRVRTNVIQFRGGLVFKADRLLYHSTLDSGVIKKKTKVQGCGTSGRDEGEVVLPTKRRRWCYPPSESGGATHHER